METRRCAWLLIALAVCIAGCDALSASEEPEVVQVTVPDGFDPVPIPAFNPLTAAKVELGRQLFSDPILSRTEAVSCASCHEATRFFIDGKPRSIGVEGREGLRNAPSLLNVAYQRLLFWDGGSQTLESQVLAPLENEAEMDLPLDAVLERLMNHPDYPTRFVEVFGEGPSIPTLTQAIAAFERTLVSTGSRYDRFQTGDTQALTTLEREGEALFFGRAQCSTCHSGFLLTNQQFENNGLRPTEADSGRARITLNPQDVGRFKVPSLRNVAWTAPYMHDGRFATLEAVVAHYDAGGEGTQNQHPRIQPLHLSTQEKDALVAFLHTLTDEALIP